LLVTSGSRSLDPCCSSCCCLVLICTVHTTQRMYGTARRTAGSMAHHRTVCWHVPYTWRHTVSWHGMAAMYMACTHMAAHTSHEAGTGTSAPPHGKWFRMFT
jgi:hypothetical protein